MQQFDLILSLFSTAAGVPGTGVGSRLLECLTPNPHASLFSGSMLPRLHIFMSALTHSDQVSLGLPLLLALGIVILVMEFMHEEKRAACPNHLKRLFRRAAVTSCTTNIAQSVSTDTSSTMEKIRHGLANLNSNNSVVYGQKHKVWVLVFLVRTSRTF